MDGPRYPVQVKSGCRANLREYRCKEVGNRGYARCQSLHYASRITCTYPVQSYNTKYIVCNHQPTDQRKDKCSLKSIMPLVSRYLDHPSPYDSVDDICYDYDGKYVNREEYHVLKQARRKEGCRWIDTPHKKLRGVRCKRQEAPEHKGMHNATALFLEQLSLEYDVPDE